MLSNMTDMTVMIHFISYYLSRSQCFINIVSIFCFTSCHFSTAQLYVLGMNVHSVYLDVLSVRILFVVTKSTLSALIDWMTYTSACI